MGPFGVGSWLFWVCGYLGFTFWRVYEDFLGFRV